MLYEFLSLHECGIIKIPENFLFLSEELSGIFAFMDLWSQTSFFSLWVHMRKRAGFTKGEQVPWILGFQ